MKTLHKRCAGLDVHKKEVVACLRVVARSKATYEVRRFPTTTRDLIALAEWLEAAQCTHVAMEATGVYWKPVWLGDREPEPLGARRHPRRRCQPHPRQPGNHGAAAQSGAQHRPRPTA